SLPFTLFSTEALAIHNNLIHFSGILTYWHWLPCLNCCICCSCNWCWDQFLFTFMRLLLHRFCFNRLIQIGTKLCKFNRHLMQHCDHTFRLC
ncbi:unnamed protein product, partial [Effrenium voratum]